MSVQQEKTNAVDPNVPTMLPGPSREELLEDSSSIITNDQVKMMPSETPTRPKQPKSKLVVWYDQDGKYVGEKKVKVDEWGNPIKKKKKKKERNKKPPNSNPSSFRNEYEDGAHHDRFLSSIGLVAAHSAAEFVRQSHPVEDNPDGMAHEVHPNSNEFSVVTRRQQNKKKHKDGYAAEGPSTTTPATNADAYAYAYACANADASPNWFGTHDLVVQFMISNGTDPDVAEALVTQFEHEQRQGMETSYSSSAAATAASIDNGDNQASFHDDDDENNKLMMGWNYENNNTEGSVASAVFRALAQGRSRAKREQNEQQRISASSNTISPPSFARPSSSNTRARSMHNFSQLSSNFDESMNQYMFHKGAYPNDASQIAYYSQFDEQGNQPSPERTQNNLSYSRFRHGIPPFFHQEHMEASMGGAHSYPRQVSAPTALGASPILQRSIMQQTQSRAHWTRADRPETVDMEGRAFGAPRRVERDPNRSNTIMRLDVEADMINNENVIEAMPATDEQTDIVYAESSSFGFKYLLALFCFVIAGVAVGVTVFSVIRYCGSGSVQVVDTISSTGSPSFAPSLIAADIEMAAIAISGSETVLTPESPQRRAVGWLLSVDEFDTEGVGLIISERYILTVFYYAMKGENWLEQEQWLSPILHVCDWSIGVTCASHLSRKQVVTGIDLTRNGLSSQIPSEIGLIEGLTLLRLAKNAINGTIPPEISELTNLVNLDLSANQLSGPVPSGIGNLQNLLVLDFMDNSLTGTIPSSIYLLGLLKNLYLSNNKLTGTLSQNISNLVSLGTLDVKSNLLNGTIPTFAGLTSLKFIWLDDNRFSGTFAGFE